MYIFSQNVRTYFDMMDDERERQPAFEKDLLSPSEIQQLVPHLSANNGGEYVHVR